MPKKATYNTKKDYFPEIVSINAERLSRGLPILMEGSPEYNEIIDSLKNKNAAKRIAGVFVIQELVKKYVPNDEKFEITEGGQVIGLDDKPGITKADKKENAMFG